VPDASGYLCFDSDHNPIGKPTPIMELTADGQLRYVRPFSPTGVYPPSAASSGSATSSGC
jgi:hypothetical protein